MDKNQDWPSEILHQLIGLNKKCDSLNQSYSDLVGKFDTLNQIITGNGAPEKGLIVRVDRLSEESKRRSSWTKYLVGSSVGSIVSVIIMLIKFLGHH